MRKYFLLAILIVISVSFLGSQNLKFSPEQLKQHVFVLASDSLQGRATGTEGQYKAANYISSEFQKYGLSELPNGGYFHYYTLVRQHENSILVKCNGSLLFAPWHYHFVSGFNHNDTLSTQLIFCGFGTDKEVEAVDTEGKAIAFLAYTPQEAYGRILELKSRFGNQTYFVIFPTKNKNVERAWESKYVISKLNLESKFQKAYNVRVTEDWAEPNDSVNVFYCFTDVLQNIFGHSDKALELKSKDQQSLEWLKQLNTPNLQCFMNYNDSLERVTVENVGAVVYGKNRSQVVTVTAHYDHLGTEMGDVFYGADDNASGTAALLELARLINQNKLNGQELECSVLFMAFSGEEMGLYGSKAYVNNPSFSLDSTILNINMDMIGRWDERHENKRDFVYILNGGRGSKKYYKLAQKHTQYPKEFKVSKNPGRYEKEVYRFGSDHFSFSEKNVPFSVIFTGLHDDYHTPNDTPDKINYKNLGNITQLLYQYIYKIADNPNAYPLRFKR